MQGITGKLFGQLRDQHRFPQVIGNQAACKPAYLCSNFRCVPPAVSCLWSPLIELAAVWLAPARMHTQSVPAAGGKAL